MLKKIKICQTVIEIDSPFYPEENFYLDRFLTEDEEADIRVSCVLTDNLPEVKEKLMGDNSEITVFESENEIFRFFKMGTEGGALTVYSKGVPDCSVTNIFEKNSRTSLDCRYFWLTLSFAQLLLPRDVLFFHASFINAGGKGIIFSAPSGTGKSTQAALWEKYRNAEIINGDKTGISRSRDCFFANGLPFCGTSDICKNVSVPLSAVVLLEQAKENSITRLYGISAIEKLISNIYLDFTASEERLRCVDLLIDLLSKVPVYLFKCTADEKAVITLENELQLNTDRR